MAGAPKGNNNSGKGRLWARAIDKAMAKRSKTDAFTEMIELAGQLLVKCGEGDLTALKELGDRLDGKPAQSIGIHGEEDKPPVTIIERLIVHATDKDSEGI